MDEGYSQGKPTPCKADFLHITLHDTQQYTYTDSSRHITGHKVAKTGGFIPISPGLIFLFPKPAEVSHTIHPIT